MSTRSRTEPVRKTHYRHRPHEYSGLSELVFKTPQGKSWQLIKELSKLYENQMMKSRFSKLVIFFIPVGAFRGGRTWSSRPAWCAGPERRPPPPLLVLFPGRGVDWYRPHRRRSPRNPRTGPPGSGPSPCRSPGRSLVEAGRTPRWISNYFNC